MTPRLLQLVALRAQVEALIALEGGESVVEEGRCPTCGAGPEDQIDNSTLDGVRRLVCRRCKVEREI
jgi:formate dehydrogenase maturation protein FdhE